MSKNVTPIITLALSLMAATSAQGQIENITITSAASFEKGLPDNGSLAAIFCTGLTGLNGTVQASGFPLPRELAGVQVTIGGAPAPILAVAALDGYQQINVQVPLEARVDLQAGGVVIVVLSGGLTGTSVVESSRPNPAGDFFCLPGDYRLGTGYLGIFQHAEDFSQVTSENPARAGETVIGYLTGLPPPDPRVPTGESAPASPPAEVRQWTESPLGDYDYYRIRIGDLERNPVEIRPSFLGLTPGLAGVYQVTFTIPADWGGGTWLNLTRHRCVRFFSQSCTPSVTPSGPVVLPVAPRDE